MKLTKNALTVLKNFSSINHGLVVSAGSKLRTVSVAKDVAAEAIVDVEFPKDFAIYDLNEFLSTISMFEDPNLDFEEDYVKISSGKASARYFYSSASVIISPSDAVLDTEGDHSFELDAETLSAIQRAAAIMKLDDLSISGGASGVTLSVADGSNTSSNQYVVEVECDADTFDMNLAIENLKVIPADYNVQIVGGSYAVLKNEQEKITYWIVANQD